MKLTLVSFNMDISPAGQIKAGFLLLLLFKVEKHEQL